MTLYNAFNWVLLAEYAMMIVFAALDQKPIICVYWFGAVILQLGITLGLK
jgi:hypothetical protein